MMKTLRAQRSFESLQSHAEIDIAGECANGMEAVKAVAEPPHKPNLISSTCRAQIEGI